MKSSRIKLKRVVNSLVLATVMCVVSNAVVGQKFMIGYGLSAYTDLAFVSAVNADYEVPTSTLFSLVSLSAEMKYNVKEFNSDMALSVAASPGLGLMSSMFGTGNGVGNLKIPVYLQLDFGNLSTFESMKDKGFGIGLGIEYHNLGLFGGNSSDENNTNVAPVIAPAARLGYRYFNRNNNSREIALKIGLPAKTDAEFETQIQNIDGTFETITATEEVKITSVQLSWIVYFNY